MGNEGNHLITFKKGGNDHAQKSNSQYRVF